MNISHIKKKAKQRSPSPSISSLLCISSQNNLLKKAVVTWCLHFLSCLLNALHSDFCLYHSNKTAFVKVISDRHALEPNGQPSGLTLLDP